MLLRNRLCFGLMAVALMLISFTIRSHTIYPPKLRQGDQVALVASAFPPQEPIDIDRAVKRLHQLGLSVKIGKSVKQKWGGLAGSDRLRADELNRMFADPGIKAIFEIRGGWGTARLLPLLDYKLIANNPKIDFAERYTGQNRLGDISRHSGQLALAQIYGGLYEVGVVRRPKNQIPKSL